MSVLKANRKPSPFEVEHHAYKVRTVITDLALRQFGLKEYEEKPKPDAYAGWSQNQKDGYDRNIAKRKERYEAFVEWFIPDEQKAIIQITRDMVHEIFLANEISPQFISECDERRIHQDLALGHCENLIQELQYIITTLPVNIEKRLEALGMTRGTSIAVLNSKSRGVLIVKVRGTRFALGRNITKNILVG